MYKFCTAIYRFIYFWLLYIEYCRRSILILVSNTMTRVCACCALPPKLKKIMAAGVITQESDLGRRCRSVVAIPPSSLRPCQFLSREDDGRREVEVVNEHDEAKDGLSPALLAMQGRAAHYCQVTWNKQQS